MVALTTAAKNIEPQAIIIEDEVDNLKNAISYLCAHCRHNTPLDLGQRIQAGKQKGQTYLWNKIRYELLQFQDENNHISVPDSHKKLYIWVSTQQGLYKAGTLLIERQIILEEMDFVFDQQKLSWSTQLASLIKYKSENGHTLVPRSAGQLGSWVNTQRRHYSNYELSDERITELNNIQFIWVWHAVTTATSSSRVIRSLKMISPMTGVIQIYHYNFETMSNGKTYFCCQQLRCNQKVATKVTSRFKRHLNSCIKNQARKAEKKQKKYIL